MIEADDGVELWIEQTGGDPGAPLVLCHGGPGMWDNLGPLAALLDRDRPVIRWDQRAPGQAPGLDTPDCLTSDCASNDGTGSIEAWPPRPQTRLSRVPT